MVTLADLEHALEARQTDATVGDICTGRIPVVDRRNPRRVLGVLRRNDIVHAYSYTLADTHEREHHIARLCLEAAIGAEPVEIDLDADDAAVGKWFKKAPLVLAICGAAATCGSGPPCTPFAPGSLWPFMIWRLPGPSRSEVP